MAMLDTTHIEQVRAELLAHPVYPKLDSPAKVRVFMKHHVFAVWDFMSLLKRLQQLLTCTIVPWMPEKETQYARFINEIVLGEESDEDGQGGFISHFDLYLRAMEEVGADTAPICGFLDRLRQGLPVVQALNSQDIPNSVRDFVSATIEIAQSGEAHQVAAAFFFGREDIIPDMFTHLVREVENKGGNADRLVYYLNRHIELDDDSYGPLSEQLLAYLTGDDAKKEQEAQETSLLSLQKRIQLWNGVIIELDRNLND